MLYNWAALDADRKGKSAAMQGAKTPGREKSFKNLRLQGNKKPRKVLPQPDKKCEN
jgi:hypothetical protein